MEFRDKQIAAPRSWETFEDLCLSLFKAIWKDDLAQKHGRNGQPQHGVDVFSYPDGRRGIFNGVLCKGKDQTYGHKATLPELQAEIKKAEGFKPRLEHWVFATTAPKEAELQLAAREISRARAQRGEFTVTVLGWEDICSLLADHPGVAEEFYPEHAFDLRGILAALRDLPKGEDLRALMAHLESNRPIGSPAVWTTVQFEQARDLGPALMGRPLGPADVAACPTLPEAQAIVAELERAFTVRLLGEPGAGKSVCALQAARILALRGWQVVRLLDPAVASLELESKGGPTLFLVDDAHLTPAPVLRAAEESAGSGSLLLTAHNALEQSAVGPGSIRLDAWLLDRCVAYAKAHKHPDLTDLTIWQAFEAERPQLVQIRGPFDGFHATQASVSKTCLVRFDNNKYSVVSRAVGRPVEIQAYADRIVIRQDGAIVGDHPRCFGRGETIYDPWHYVPVLARKPGALRNGAPFKDWPLPASLGIVRRKLKGSDDGDRQMVKILSAVLTEGLTAVEAACAEALADGVHSADVVLNILSRHRDPGPAATILTPDALRLQHQPIADCARYDRLRRAS